jgi:nodulation protein E
MAFGIRSPVFTVSSACASSNHAIATAVWLLGNSVIDAAVVGGTEAPLTYGTLKAWEALRVMATDTCRPFDRHRKGLVLAEGAGMVVLERAGYAKARGAEILAQIAGVGMSADAADLVRSAHYQHRGSRSRMRSRRDTQSCAGTSDPGRH